MSIASELTNLAANRDAIKAAGYSDTVAVLVTNSDELENMDCGLK